jgi:hypothetical protein
MTSQQNQQHIVILGAGVIGLTTSLVLSHTYPTAKISVVAKHFPGDRSIEYTSPWAGANWSSMAHDNGPLEKYDEVTFHRFGELIDGRSVFGCQTLKPGETEGVDGVNGGGNEAGLGRMGMWGVFDAPIEETGILTEETGKVWYDELVGGLKNLGETELPKGATFGFEFPSTFRINTQVYLQWYVVVSIFPNTQDSSCKFSLQMLTRYQAPSSSPLQRHFPSAPTLPFRLSCPPRLPIHHALGKLHRSRLPQTLRHQRHKSIPNTRSNTARRRTKNANHQNV